MTANVAVRSALAAVVATVRMGRDAVAERHRLESQLGRRDWEDPSGYAYRAGWADATVAVELAAVNESARLAEEITRLTAWTDMTLAARD